MTTLVRDRPGNSAGKAVLAAFVRRHGQDILAHWHQALERERRTGELLAARVAPGGLELLEGVADALDEAGLSVAARVADRHAMRRLREGAALGQILREQACLRDCIFAACEQDVGGGPHGSLVRHLHEVFDALASASAERYIAARDRTLRILDRFSGVVYASRNVDDVLQGLLQVIIDASSTIDTASVFLREGDSLVARVGVGLEELVRGSGLRVRIGEGAAGRAAAERRPRLLGAEEIGPDSVGPLLRSKGLRSLYVIPLQTDHELVGVAQFGSKTAGVLSDTDRRLLLEVCSRAPAAIRWQLAQDSAARRARDLETVLESLPDAVLVGDGGGIRHANRAALDLIGVDSVERLNRPGMTLSEVVEARRIDTGETLPPEERPFAAALRGETVTREVIVRHQRTGQDVILRCAVAPVRSETAIVGAVAVCTDITSHKKQDEERERLYRQARQAVADRQHVLEIVSHDLRTPLSSVAFAAATLGDDQMPAELRTHAAGALARGVDRMTRMISDLLDANSIEAGRLTVKPLPQDPVSIVEEVVELFAAQAVSRGVALAAEIRGVLPLVRGDRHRLIQALTNLVSNALKVTSEGSVTIAAESHGSEVIFGVTDTGPGIREEDRPRLFEPYWRAENAVYKGTGLGLAIVHGIVQAHGGRVWAETPAHRGAAILFSVPSA